MHAIFKVYQLPEGEEVLPTLYILESETKGLYTSFFELRKLPFFQVKLQGGPIKM
jgi:hypothetical protein